MDGLVSNKTQTKGLLSKLEPVSLDEMKALIDESNKAFLAPVSNPSQTTKVLIESLSGVHDFTPFGYKLDGVLVSYIIGLGHKNNETISIGPMYVSRAHQGCGLGHRQVQDFISIAKKQGYKKLFTKTWLGNKGSRIIFESNGFVESGITPHDRVGGDSTITYLLHF